MVAFVSLRLAPGTKIFVPYFGGLRNLRRFCLSALRLAHYFFGSKKVAQKTARLSKIFVDCNDSLAKKSNCPAYAGLDFLTLAYRQSNGQKFCNVGGTFLFSPNFLECRVIFNQRNHSSRQFWQQKFRNVGGHFVTGMTKVRSVPKFTAPSKIFAPSFFTTFSISLTLSPLWNSPRKE